MAKQPIVTFKGWDGIMGRAAFVSLSAILAVLTLAGCTNPLAPESASKNANPPIAGISAAAPAIGAPRTDIGTLQQDRTHDAQVIQDATKAVNTLTSGGR